MFIDPHVHCRDSSQSYKETIAHALSIAERAGMTAIFDMPNTSPPIDNRKAAEERIALAKKADSPVFYGLFLGVTPEAEQLKEIVSAYNEIKEVIGLKMFAGHSVGRMGIIAEEDQKKVYATLTKLGYNGVLAVHCEKESLLKPEVWNPSQPMTHALTRPPEAEVQSVKDQIIYAKQAGFKGTLHIVHVSVPEAVNLIYEEKQKKELNITCAATPHHLIFNQEDMKKENGILLKMNPPLRPEGMNTELLQMLKEGKIDWVETDHAPHALKEKIEEPYMSGIPNLHAYPKFISWLRTQGLSEKRIKQLTFGNIIKAYGLDLEQRVCVPEMEIKGEYELDPYSEFHIFD